MFTYQVEYNTEKFNIALDTIPVVFDVIKCEKGEEFMIVDIKEDDSLTDILVVIKHVTIDIDETN